MLNNNVQELMIKELVPAPLKTGALIIADSQYLINKIEVLLSKQNWPSDNMSAHLMIGQGILSAMNHRCVIFVIDHHFRKSFSGLMVETSTVIRNISKHTPIYLLLENDDDALVASWRHYVKAIFKSALETTHLHQALQHITHSESDAAVHILPHSASNIR